MVKKTPTKVQAPYGDTIIKNKQKTLIWGIWED